MPSTSTAELQGRALKKGARVVATTDLRGVPEGTAGKVKVVNGLGPWIRCWVHFDNGVWMGSVAGSKLVAEKDWPEFQQLRTEEAANASKRAEQAAAAAAAPPEEAAAEPAAAKSKVPAHLLERAKAAREKKAAAASGE
jgi:hypothetical protein